MDDMQRAVEFLLTTDEGQVQEWGVTRKEFGEGVGIEDETQLDKVASQLKEKGWVELHRSLGRFFDGLNPTPEFFVDHKDRLKYDPEADEEAIYKLLEDNWKVQFGPNRISQDLGLESKRVQRAFSRIRYRVRVLVEPPLFTITLPKA